MLTIRSFIHKTGMKEILQELNTFLRRKEDLRSITRYSLYSVMWYRTNLWTHSRRVSWIVEGLSPFASEVFGSEFNPERAFVLALVHDDAEIIMGDVQAGNKSKMSREELHELEDIERKAAIQLAERYPSHIGSYEYRSLLFEALDKLSLEALVVDWADKYDAFGEALHELYAGHRAWATNVVNAYGTISLPTDYYKNYFNKFVSKFPRSEELFEKKNPIFQVPVVPDAHTIVERGVLHTPHSIKERSGYEPYDFWISTTVSHGTMEDVENLYTKKEYP